MYSARSRNAVTEVHFRSHWKFCLYAGARESDFAFQVDDAVTLDLVLDTSGRIDLMAISYMTGIFSTQA
jgi:hypothetical protein